MVNLNLRSFLRTLNFKKKKVGNITEEDQLSFSTTAVTGGDAVASEIQNPIRYHSTLEDVKMKHPAEEMILIWSTATEILYEIQDKGDEDDGAEDDDGDDNDHNSDDNNGDGNGNSGDKNDEGDGNGDEDSHHEDGGDEIKKMNINSIRGGCFIIDLHIMLEMKMDILLLDNYNASSIVQL